MNILRRIIVRLSTQEAARKIARKCRLHVIANAYLRKFPMVKRLPTGTLYRATRLESIPLAAEMFEKGSLYPADLLPKHFSTFADLGCNVGYFGCWVASLAAGRVLKGIMVDANPETLEEAKWHMKANGLHDVHVINGIVGEGKKGDNAEFYVYESNICSTSHLPQDLKSKLDGEWKKIFVPCLQISEQWKQRFGETRCHLLKIDVEGSEFKFLESEKPFLALCDAIFIEWHTWSTSLNQITTILESCGFTYSRVIEKNESMGTAVFLREHVM